MKRSKLAVLCLKQVIKHRILISGQMIFYQIVLKLEMHDNSLLVHVNSSSLYVSGRQYINIISHNHQRFVTCRIHILTNALPHSKYWTLFFIFRKFFNFVLAEAEPIIGIHVPFLQGYNLSYLKLLLINSAHLKHSYFIYLNLH